MLNIFETKHYSSEKNQTITAMRFLNVKTLATEKIIQTGYYTNAMWKDAFKKFPKDFAPHNILILGLGGGGSINYLKRLYPHARISVIEWDEVMIQAAREIKIADLSNIEILLGDARKLVKTINRTFDLIVLDLFTANDISQVVQDNNFAKNLSERLNPAGFLLANLFLDSKPNLALEQYFKPERFWKFTDILLPFYNYLALYRLKSYANLPEGYKTFRSNASFIKREYRDKAVLAGGAIGFSWNTIGLTFERYEGDIEPQPQAGGRIKIAIWQPITRQDKPKGWRRSFDQLGNKRSGFAEITHPQNYWKNWSPHALRHRNKWLKIKNKDWFISESEPEEFVEALKKIHKREAKFGALLQLKRSIANQKENLRLFVAKDSKGLIHAGFAAVDVPEISQSYHLTSFHDEQAKHDSVGTGLIDEWFRTSADRGIRFLDFWVFWSPGENRHWKGFSKFKAQFATNYINYPKPLIKFLKPKKR